jgi:magnesium chelatase subunit I
MDTQQIEMWFNLGGTVKLDDAVSADAALAELSGIQGLMEKLSALGLKLSDNSAVLVGGAEFLLEGLVAHRKLSRNEERGFAAQEKPQRKQETHKMEIDYEEWEKGRRSRRGYN